MHEEERVTSSAAVQHQPDQPERRTYRTLIMMIAAVALAGVAGASFLWPQPVSRNAASTIDRSSAPPPVVDDVPRRCRKPADQPFAPTAATVAGVASKAPVLGLPRDSDGVPGVPEPTQLAHFAWDLDAIRPGSPRGNVLLNAHTAYGQQAIGNELLNDLRVGGLIVLHGRRGEILCYRVTRRIEVDADAGYPAYYDMSGPAQVALVVCSGERQRRSGTNEVEYTHRTIWFGSPT